MRRCHGDLHLRNIVIARRQPILFDALEFDEAMATGDVLYDLAFLVMDFWERGFRKEANGLLNRYLWESADEAHLAGPRTSSRLPEREGGHPCQGCRRLSSPSRWRGARRGCSRGATAISRFAEQFLVPAQPRLLAIGGLSGTGKTTIAEGARPLMGRRQELCICAATSSASTCSGRLRRSACRNRDYSAAATTEVYGRMQRKAKLALEAGFSVICRCRTCLSPTERAGIERLRAKVAFHSTGFGSKRLFP